jgi:hypothetical protein
MQVLCNQADDDEKHGLMELLLKELGFLRILLLQR